MLGGSLKVEIVPLGGFTDTDVSIEEVKGSRSSSNMWIE